MPIPLPNLIGLIVLLGILGIAFAPRFLGFLADRMGEKGTAIVLSATTSAVMDENKRYYKKLELDVTVPGMAPFKKTVRQHLPWYIGSGPSAGTKVAVRVLKATKSVAVTGPDPEDRTNPLDQLQRRG